MEDDVSGFGIDEKIPIAGADGAVAFGNGVIGKRGGADCVCDCGALAVRRIGDEVWIWGFIGWKCG